MTQQEFDLLTEKYIAGQCSEKEVAFLEKWADIHFNQQSKTTLFDSDKAEKETEAKIWQSLKKQKTEKRGYVIPWLWAVAASLLLLAGYFLIPESTPAGAPKFDKVSHTSTKVTLPDGSVVILEKGADIVTDKHFGVSQRKVWLKGEAFFQVTPNPQVPFVVQTGDLITEVLGTSFRIKPEQGRKNIEVSVVTGKVSIYTTGPTGKNKKNGVIATPNQKISYDPVQKTLRQDLVDVPEPVVPVEASVSFQFEEEPIETVLARISKIYGVQMIPVNPALKHCVFTGDLSGLDMYRQLDLMCEVIGASYEVRGTAIFVSGPGCQANQ